MVAGVDAVVQGLHALRDDLGPGDVHLLPFLDTYRRTTIAVGEAVDDGLFEDGAWVVRWDVAFAELYTIALRAYLAGREPSRPWRFVFDTAPDLPALLHVLLGVNAHVNYDLPQALLEVIPDADFDQSSLLESRRRDHQRIDSVLARRVAAEERELGRTPRSLTSRMLKPVHRIYCIRLLREARRQVWSNTVALHSARLEGPLQQAARLAELESLTVARMAGMIHQPRGLLRVVTTGFGVTLPSSGGSANS